ncbi:MAG: uracil-DNA glycosylase [Sphingomonas sp.]|nr:uracil-DNA glycosylase [Sphingomonas sp.]
MADSVALSALDWWAEAGVDTLVDDLPRDWLAAAPVSTMAETSLAEMLPVLPTPATSVTLPDTLEAFRAFLLTDAAIPGPANTRIDAIGDPSSGIVVVVDMPEAEDRASGKLLSGEVGALFDRMLGAIKLERAQAYLIPFSPARPTSGRLAEAQLKALKPLLLHHLGLIAPKKLLLLGDAPVQALLGQPAAKARDAEHTVTIGTATVPTVATIHPRLVSMKREWRPLIWADLQRFEKL